MTTPQLELSSPDGRIALTVEVYRGDLTYRLSYRTQPIVARSKLGLAIKNSIALGADLEIISTKESSVDQVWPQIWGERAEIHDLHRELEVHLQEVTSLRRRLIVRFRLFNDGLGFRYEIPFQGNLKAFEVMDEQTEFRFSEASDAWWIPAYQADRYEYLFSKTKVSHFDTVHTPLTLRTPNGVYATIHEAGLYDYGSMTIKQRDGVLSADITPLSSGSKAAVTSPMVLPWRTISVAHSAIELLSSTLMLNLNAPPEGDFSWVKPVKFMGIWWGMFTGEFTWSQGDRHGATTENAKRYIDSCREYGMEALLIEGWNEGWDGNWMENGARFDFTKPYADFDIVEVCRYAREQGIELIGHHETSGDVANYERQLPAAFEFYATLGIRYVKLGYVGSRMNHQEFHHSQFGVRHYQKVIELAAQYKMMLDIHEPIKGTGIERTWPNVLTREGGRGQEYEGGGITPDHLTIVPFTRGMAGPFDYTPGIFDITNYAKRVTSTLARQLGLYVIIHSGMQMAADTPEAYAAHRPAFQFIQDVPVDWAETVPLQGAIGEYILIARKDRHSEDWYVGGATNEEARRCKLELSFLAPDTVYQAQIYKDGTNAHWRDDQLDIMIETQTVTAEETLELRMAQGGGFAIRFTIAD